MNHAAGCTCERRDYEKPLMNILGMEANEDPKEYGSIVNPALIGERPWTD